MHNSVYNGYSFAFALDSKTAELKFHRILWISFALGLE